MNIIPFVNNSGLPAYLRAFNVTEVNNDLTAHAGQGFPVVSIRGKTWAIVRDGERTVLPNPKDPDSPATSIEVVMLKVNKNKSKVFYLKGYDPDSSEGQKPDCYSNNGETPEPDSPHLQSKSCATCPHNQWASRVTERGASKGKACSDTVRLAIAPAGQLNDPMLLRVPPASNKALGEYGQLLAKRGVPYNAVITKIGFDPEAESPKLTFKPVGFLDEAGFAEVQKTLTLPAVEKILATSVPTEIPAAAVHPQLAEGENPATPVKAKEKEVRAEEVQEAVQAAAKTAAPAKKVAPKKAEPEPKPAAADDLDLDLDGINFDD